MEIGNPSITNAPAENHAMRCGSVLYIFIVTKKADKIDCKI